MSGIINQESQRRRVRVPGNLNAADSPVKSDFEDCAEAEGQGGLSGGY